MMGFMPGPLELLILGAIALLLFGTRPPAARYLGASLHEFQAGLKAVEADPCETIGTPSTP